MKCLKIYFSEKDRFKGKTLEEFLLKFCKDSKISGITIYKAIMGFGKKLHIHRNDFFSLSDELPIVAEIIEEDEIIENILETLDKIDFDGISTTHEIKIHKFKKNKKSKRRKNV